MADQEDLMDAPEPVLATTIYPSWRILLAELKQEAPSRAVRVKVAEISVLVLREAEEDVRSGTTVFDLVHDLNDAAGVYSRLAAAQTDGNLQHMYGNIATVLHRLSDVVSKIRHVGTDR